MEVAAAADEPADLWTAALPRLVEAGHHALAHRVVVERLRDDPFFSVQPDHQFHHARALRGLGRLDEARRAVRSALQDMPWNTEYQALVVALDPTFG